MTRDRKGTLMNIQTKQKQFFQGAFLLTLAGIISKVLSAGYRIPLQNIAGDVGFYIYQQVYPILGMAFMLSLYGFPVAISSLVAQWNGKGKSISITSFILPIFFMLSGISILFFTVLFFGAGQISDWMGDEQLVLPIQVTSVVFLLLPFTSLMRGIFQGNHNMQPTAISQMTEQLVRVLVIIGATFFFVQAGYNLYYVGAGAAFGSILGAFVAILVLVAYMVKKQPWQSHEKGDTIPFRTLFRTIIVVGLFLCVNYMMLLFLQLADSLTIISKLQLSGFTLTEAKEIKGIYDRGYPLIQIGTVVGSSIALALIPTITKKRLEERKEATYSDARSAVKFSFLFSIAATCGLIVVLPYVNVAFFKSDEGTEALQILSVVILFGALALTYSSLLQGFSIVKAPAVAVGAGFVVKLALNEMLIRQYGISGSAIASVLAVVVIAVINYVLLKKHFRLQLKRYMPWKQITLAILAMVLVVIGTGKVYQWLWPLQTRWDYLFITLCMVIAGAMTYIYLLVRTGAFSDQELDQFPFRDKLRKMVRKESKR